MHKIFTLMICAALFSNLEAQTKPKNDDKSNQQEEIVKDLFNSYKFDEAATLLQKEITTAKKKGKNTELFESYLDFANLGENMLTSTENITFIDSIVVDKNRFLDIYKLGEETGKIDLFKNIFRNVKVVPEVANSYTYTPQLRDKMYFSNVVDSALYIFTCDRLDDTWSEAVQAKGLENFGYDQIAPFVLSDGTTMYFAAKGEQSLGGYDIFLTRYNQDENKFLKPENIGMPFNSPANDYMYAIDEINNLGWFVSDRGQTEGKVCVYVFIPNETRENYAFEDEDILRNFARINAISDTWKGKKTQVDEALKRLKNLFSDSGQDTKVHDFIFVVNDNKTYTSLSDFKNAEAKKYASQWFEATKLYAQQSDKLETDRNNYANATKAEKQNLRTNIIEEEKQIAELQVFIKKLEKLIRQHETSK